MADTAGAGGAPGAAPSEQRREVRIPTRLVVAYRVEGTHTDLVRESSDVSYSGMFVVTAEAPAQGSRVRFEIHDPEQGPLARGSAMVRWVRPELGLPGKPGGMGLQFLDLDEASRRWVSRIADNRLTALTADVHSAPAMPRPRMEAGAVPWTPAADHASMPGLRPAPQMMPTPMPPVRERTPARAALVAAVLGLVLGLVLGAVLGWFARGIF